MFPICHTCNTTKVKTSEDKEPAHLNWECLSLQCEELRQSTIEPRVHFNINHLQRQNRDGTTSQSEEREALGDRWNDEKVGRVT